MLFVTETKMKIVNFSIVRNLWSCQSVGWVELVLNGALGVLL